MVSYKNSYFTMACRAFHASICNGIRVNHTPCQQHDYTATKAMDILLYN